MAPKISNPNIIMGAIISVNASFCITNTFITSIIHDYLRLTLLWNKYYENKIETYNILSFFYVYA